MQWHWLLRTNNYKPMSDASKGNKGDEIYMHKGEYTIRKHTKITKINYIRRTRTIAATQASRPSKIGRPKLPQTTKERSTLTRMARCGSYITATNIDDGASILLEVNIV